MQKTATLEQLKKLFLKKRVLEIHDVIAAVNATSRMTAYRYLKKLDYISNPMSQCARVQPSPHYWCRKPESVKCVPCTSGILKKIMCDPDFYQVVGKTAKWAEEKAA